jgi:hypothetical protein
VEVGDLSIVKDIAHGWFIGSCLVVEDLLFQGVEPVFVSLHRYGGVGLMIGDSLEQAISDASEKDSVQIQLSLQGCLNGARRKGNRCQGCSKSGR